LDWADAAGAQAKKKAAMAPASIMFFFILLIVILAVPFCSKKMPEDKDTKIITIFAGD